MDESFVDEGRGELGRADRREDDELAAVDEVAERAATRPTLHRVERDPVLTALTAKDAQRRPFSVVPADVVRTMGRIMVAMAPAAERSRPHRLGCG